MPVTSISCWFETWGFSVLHTPGISRAWRYELTDGSSLLVTNLDGYDLPEAGGPYAVIYLSPREELVEFVPLLEHPRDVYRYLQRRLRTIQNSSIPTDVSSV